MLESPVPSPEFPDKPIPASLLFCEDSDSSRLAPSHSYQLLIDWELLNFHSKARIFAYPYNILFWAYHWELLV